MPQHPVIQACPRDFDDLWRMLVANGPPKFSAAQETINMISEELAMGMLATQQAAADSAATRKQEEASFKVLCLSKGL